MPGGDRTGSPRGRGRGKMGGPFAAGPGGYCVCPSCGYRGPHIAGDPCNRKLCPQCRTPLARETLHEQELMLQLVDTVPHWYVAGAGPFTYSLQARGQELVFASHVPLSRDLSPLYDFMQRGLGSWADSMPDAVTLRDLSQIRRELVIAWLRQHDQEVQWEKLFAWADNMQFRTAENRPVIINLLLSPGKGDTDITQVSLQKGLDSIATIGQVFLEVDKELRFLDYREILVEDICEGGSPGFNPEFLDPFVSVLGPDQWSFHITEAGDTLVLDQGGLMASARKGRWFVYDRPALAEALTAIFGDHELAINVLITSLNLSYRRRGALLVFDPDHRVVDHLVECACRIGDPNRPPSGIHALLASRVATISMGATRARQRQPKLVLELATLDGAILFDQSSVLAFGAVIHMHDSARNQLGARTTAAYSARHWGGVPVMISADGEMTILFESQAPETGEIVQASLSFL